jgi:cytochrome c2
MLMAAVGDYLRRPTLYRAVAAMAGIVMLGSTFVAGAFAHRYRVEIRSFFSDAVRSGGLIQTSLYTVSMALLPIPGEGRDGGVEPLGAGLLLVNRRGQMWYVSERRALERLEVVVPVNVEEFERDEFNVATSRLDQFGVKDVLVQSIPGGLRLLASHNHWDAENDCYVLRVSGLEATEEEIRHGSAALQSRWRTYFDTTPCVPLESGDGVNYVPSMDAGGRLAALSDDEILLTVGHFAVADIGSLDNSYGKTIFIDLRTQSARPYTIGHRNPQGLIVSSDGTVWSTEHGPRGGDELNRLIDGRHYGFPVVTYGTQYGAQVWEPNPRQGRHDGFEKPVYAWVPSVGISQLIEVDSVQFPYWNGDLLVASLDGRSLFRLRVEDERVVFAEPMPIGHRIRDITQLRDGAIALKTDDDLLIFLTSLDSATLGALDPVSRGEALSNACVGCHSLTRDGETRIGPSLWGIVGRDIASQRFAYSPALEALDGEWTPSRLRSYILDPQSYAPGTLMPRVASYDASVVDDIVAYLETLQ